MTTCVCGATIDSQECQLRAHTHGPTPTTCREHLGRDLGYCDGAIQTTDVNGRGFCVEHAKERGF